MQKWLLYHWESFEQTCLIRFSVFMFGQIVKFNYELNLFLPKYYVFSKIQVQWWITYRYYTLTEHWEMFVIPLRKVRTNLTRFTVLMFCQIVKFNYIYVVCQNERSCEKLHLVNNIDIGFLPNFHKCLLFHWKSFKPT